MDKSDRIIQDYKHVQAILSEMEQQEGELEMMVI